MDIFSSKMAKNVSFLSLFITDACWTKQFQECETFYKDVSSHDIYIYICTQLTNWASCRSEHA